MFFFNFLYASVLQCDFPFSYLFKSLDLFMVAVRSCLLMKELRLLLTRIGRYIKYEEPGNMDMPNK